MWRKNWKWGIKWERLEREWEEKGGERERIEGKKARKWASVWEDEMRSGGSGDYRLSGVFYLWSKCTLAFLLSTPQMQLDSLLAKQTQMKWLLNDFLGNPPRQRKPSIWSLLFPSLPPFFSSVLPLFPHPSSSYFLLWFSVISPLYFSMICSSFFFFWSLLYTFFFLDSLPYSLSHFFFCFVAFFMPLLPLPPSDLHKNAFSNILKNQFVFYVFIHNKHISCETIT